MIDSAKPHGPGQIERRRRRRISLFWKILILAIVVSLVPLGIALTTSLQTASHMAEALVGKTVIQLADRVSERIEYTLVSIESDLEVLRHTPAKPEAVLAFFEGQTRELFTEDGDEVRVPKYREAALYDPEGRPLVVIRDGHYVSDDPVFRPRENRWCESDDFVAETRALVTKPGGRIQTMTEDEPPPIFVSGLIGCHVSISQYRPANGALGSHFDGGIRVSMPMFGPNGAIAGVATLVLSELHLQWALASVGAAGGEASAWSMMVDQEGWAISHPNPDRTRGFNEDGMVFQGGGWSGDGSLHLLSDTSPVGAVFRKVVERANRGEEGTVDVQLPEEGDWLLAYHPVRASIGAYGNEYPIGTTLVFYPREAVLEVGWELRKQYALILLITLMLVLLGSFLLARNLSKLIRQLAHAAKGVARGETPVIPEPRGDELGDLARAFGQMHEALEEHKKALIRTEGLAAVGRFVAGIVHEVKNVLAGIGNYVSVLERRSDPETREKILTPMRRALDQLDILVRRMRELALNPQFAKASLSDVLDHARELVEHQAQAQGVSLEVDMASSVALTRADPSMLGQVFLNILLNAVEATPEGGHVVVQVRRKDLNAIVSVRDTGEGFPPDSEESLCEPFYTTKVGGTGLGLYISRSIVERHSGTIRLFNHPDGGAVVEVILPIVGESGTAAHSS